MSFESKVLFIKKVKKGEKVSYGLTWEAKKIPVLRQYLPDMLTDYNRLLSNRGSVKSGESFTLWQEVSAWTSFMVDAGSNCSLEKGKKQYFSEEILLSARNLSPVFAEQFPMKSIATSAGGFQEFFFSNKEFRPVISLKLRRGLLDC
jgi:hypothetical protein